MAGIMSDDDIARLGDDMEARRLVNEMEKYFLHHRETEKQLREALATNTVLQADLAKALDSLKAVNIELTRLRVEARRG